MELPQPCPGLSTELKIGPRLDTDQPAVAIDDRDGSLARRIEERSIVALDLRSAEHPLADQIFADGWQRAATGKKRFLIHVKSIHNICCNAERLRPEPRSSLQPDEAAHRVPLGRQQPPQDADLPEAARVHTGLPDLLHPTRELPGVPRHQPAPPFHVEPLSLRADPRPPPPP